MDVNNCDFCSKEVYAKQGIAENDVAKILYPNRPLIFGHFMVISKRHIAIFSELSDAELIGIKSLISYIYKIFQKKALAIGYNLLNNNGEVADQHIPHSHIHVLMRKEGDVSPFDILSKKIIKQSLSEEEWAKRISEIRSWF